jgi:hypothetical protein
MANRIKVDLRIPPEGVMLHDYELEPLQGDLYRVVDIPSPFDDDWFEFQDTLRLRRAEDGVLEVAEVVERGRWKRFEFVISEQFAKSDEFNAFVARVVSAQGVWVLDFGGCLSVFLPPSSIWNPEPELEAANTACARRLRQT